MQKKYSFIKKIKSYSNDYEITADFYSKIISRHHFGKGALENFLVNSYEIQPLIDPDIKKIKFEINKKSFHDLIVYIYIRFAHDLIYFPFEGKRKLNGESIRKAEKINKKFQPYIIKSDYNKKFFIDIKRKSPVHPSYDKNNAENYLKNLFKSSKFIRIINKLYNNNFYFWASQYSKGKNYHPLKYFYGLFSVAKVLEDLSLNEKYLKLILEVSIGTFKFF